MTTQQSTATSNQPIFYNPLMLQNYQQFINTQLCNSTQNLQWLHYASNYQQQTLTYQFSPTLVPPTQAPTTQFPPALVPPIPAQPVLVSPYSSSTYSSPNF